MKMLVISFLGLCVGMLQCQSAPDEFRGIWVDAFGPGFLNKKQVKQLVDHCREYNFNAVFVQMRRRGDAFYFPKAPNQDPRTEAVAEKFDALAEIIKQCKASEPKIEVHCWVVSHFIWAFHKPPRQPDHVYNRHPEWLTRDSLGQTIIGQGYYLDFGHPDANRSVHDMAVDIVKRYDIDGFHWDYLRYPGQDSGYNPTAIKRYNAEFDLTAEPDPKDARFSDWRRRQVSDFLRWVNADLWEIKPGLVISAAVFSNYKDSFGYRFADWVKWNEEGLLDVCIPMDFTKDNQQVFNPRANFAYANQGVRTIYLGQGAYMNSIHNILEQLRYSRGKGFKGTVLYSYRNPSATRSKVGPKPSNVDVIVDNDSATVTGNWKRGQFGKYHGEDYLYASGGDKENIVTLRPELPKSGTYALYEWHVAGRNRATNALFEIIHAEGTNSVVVNQQTKGSIWNLLGQFRFSADKSSEIQVSNREVSADRVVIADAVRFVPVPEGESVVEITQAELHLQHQEKVFSTLRKQFQPKWANTPVLSWKRKRGILKGKVTDADGVPAYNSVVKLQTNPPHMVKTDVHGAFAFMNLAPGQYVVEFSDQKRNTVRVESGQVAAKFHSLK